MLLIARRNDLKGAAPIAVRLATHRKALIPSRSDDVPRTIYQRYVSRDGNRQLDIVEVAFSDWKSHQIGDMVKVYEDPKTGLLVHPGQPWQRAGGTARVEHRGAGDPHAGGIQWLRFRAGLRHHRLYSHTPTS